MGRSNKLKGRLGEDLAAEFLVNNNFTILERNFWTRSGEIDIIAIKDETIHFIEVKHWILDKVELEYSINKVKKRRIKDVSIFFLYSHPEFDDYKIRYDLIFLSGTTMEIDYMTDVF